MVWLRGTEQRDGQGSRTQVLPSASLRGELCVLSTWLRNGLPILCPGPAHSPGPCKLSGLWHFPRVVAAVGCGEPGAGGLGGSMGPTPWHCSRGGGCAGSVAGCCQGLALCPDQ